MCGGSNVPPRMARMVARIRSLRRHGTQPQCSMRIEVAPQRFGRVDVAIADSHREVESDAPFVESDRPDDVAAPDLDRRSDTSRSERYEYDVLTPP